MPRSDALVGAWAALALAGCSFAPRLTIPDVPMAASYKEEAPWTEARPADALPREAWWTLYGDAELDTLQARLVAGSPDLAAALARYQRARGLTDQLRSRLYPTPASDRNTAR